MITQKYTEILHGVRFAKSKINASKDEENCLLSFLETLEQRSKTGKCKIVFRGIGRDLLFGRLSRLKKQSEYIDNDILFKLGTKATIYLEENRDRIEKRKHLTNIQDVGSETLPDSINKRNNLTLIKFYIMTPNRYTSLLVQAIYVILTGLQLIFVPNMLIGMFGFDPTTEIWIKVLGIVILPLSAVYYAISKQGNREVVFSTVISRGFVGIGFVLLVLSGQAKTSLILFAGIDIATAVWTWLELKRERA